MQSLFYETVGSKLGTTMEPVPGRSCPVCAKPDSITFVRNIIGDRTELTLDLYFCLFCESFHIPQHYHEDDAQLAQDLEWSKSVERRNKRFLGRLHRELHIRGVDLSSVLEIGCGHGTALDFFRETTESQVAGYDVNRQAIEYGRAHFGIDTLHDEFWTADTPRNPATIILSMSVLEHIAQPRPIFAEMAKAARQDDAMVFVSVPLVDPVVWHHVIAPDLRAPDNVFTNTDVHITMFSSKGLVYLANEFGCTHAEEVRAGGWSGLLMKFS